MDFLRWGGLLLALSPTLAQASIGPENAALSLIFPANTTFQAAPLTPVVFAVQNPLLFRSLSDPTLEWSLLEHNATKEAAYEARRRNGTTRYNDPEDPVTISRYIYSYHLINNSATTNEPHLVARGVHQLRGLEGSFEVQWHLTYSSCAYNTSTSETIPVRRRLMAGSTFFTLKNDAPLPDLVAVSTDETCPVPQGLVWDVQEVPDSPVSRSCATPASITPTPTLGGCDVQLDAATASSVLWDMTVFECRVLPPSGVGCPPLSSLYPTKTNAASITRSVGVEGWFLGLLGWLAYTLG